MSNQSVSIGALIAAATIGALLTYLGTSFFGAGDIMETSKVREPIYWVAPMDANYTREKAGKSPMGMDLIPVYADSGSENSEVGAISISPEVVNNLGVRTVAAEYRTLESNIATVGYVQYDQDLLVHIHPRIEGWIEKLHVKAAGDPVKKDQALYEIYSPALVNAQEELLLALDRKNQRLIQAAEDRLEALQLPLIAIKNLRETRKVAQHITFYAPQSGVLDNLNIREGFFVKPGTTLMSIAKLDQVWVEAEVFARQAFLIDVGAPVTMTLSYLSGKEWEGKIDYIYPTLNEMTRTLKVRLRFDNADLLLKPNMFAQVVIHSSNHKSMLMIPKEALIRSGRGDRVVLVMGEGRFKSVEVKVGAYDDDFVEILSGLDSGDKIVSSAQFLLDSESSKTSDFKRMNYSREESNLPSDNSATVEGVINSIMVDHGMINISRAAIEKWGRGPAIVDFSVAAGVSLESLHEGMNIRFTFEINDGKFVITDILSSSMNKP
ncbi:MAG: Cu(I)/Ag(I) efflux system membrane fusion protein [Candidatus Azotimanducaceae bacterium]|jgi:Cu(I)/Ag(I) efflux system membrane fusion protein